MKLPLKENRRFQIAKRIFWLICDTSAVLYGGYLLTYPTETLHVIYGILLILIASWNFKRDWEQLERIY